MLLSYLLNSHHLTTQADKDNSAAPKYLAQDYSCCKVIALVGGGGKTSCAYTLAQQAKAVGLRVLITTTTKMYQPLASDFEAIIDIASLDSNNDNISYHIESKHSKNIDKKDKNRCQHTEIENNYNLLVTQQLTSILYGTNTIHPTISDQPHACFIFNGISDITDNKDKKKVNGLSYQDIDKLKLSGLFDLIIVEADGAKHLPIKAPSRHEPCIPPQVDAVVAVTGCEVIDKMVSPALIHRCQLFCDITASKIGDTIDKKILGRFINHPDGMFKNVPIKSRRIWLINKTDLAADYDKLYQLSVALLKQSKHLDGICLASFNSSPPINDLLLR